MSTSPVKVTSVFDPSLPSPSPASASTSTLISPYPVPHLPKVMDEEIPPSIQKSTAPNSSTPPSAISIDVDAPVIPFHGTRPPNMSFAALNLHAQTLGHAITQHEGLKSPTTVLGGRPVVQQDTNEAKMSPRGLVQPHRNHLPRRVKQKNGTATPQSTPPLLPSTPNLPPTLSLGRSTERQSFDEAPTTATLTSATVPPDSNVVGGDLSSAKASSEPNPHVPFRMSTPPPDIPGVTIPPNVPKPSPRSLSTTPLEPRTFRSLSPLGPNLPRRKVSKRILPLPLSAAQSEDATPSPSPARPASPSQMPTLSSRPQTPLRSSLRTPGKTPLRCAVLAASPFVLSSESESDGEGEEGGRRERGRVQDRSDSPLTSGAVVLGSTPLRTPARGISFAPASVPGPGMFAAVESGSKKQRERGRRTTFALPFPVHGEPRPEAPADGPSTEEVTRSLPARLAVASPMAKGDQKCSQYVGVGVYVGLLTDDDEGGDKDFWEMPALDADESMEGRRLIRLDEDEKEEKRLRRIVLRVLSEEDSEETVDLDLDEDNDEGVDRAPPLSNTTSSPSCMSTDGLPAGPASVVPAELLPQPSSPPSSSSLANRGDHQQRHAERELILTLPSLSSKGRLAENTYVDGTSILSQSQMHRVWKWMLGCMNGLDDTLEEEDRKDVETTDTRPRSRSRARSTSRKDGRSRSRNKARKRSTHRRRGRQTKIQIEILSPRERRVDAMGLAVGYLCLACPPDESLIEELHRNHDCGDTYTPLHLLWMRLMDVGVSLDDHGDDPRFGGSSGGRKRSQSRKRSGSRKRDRSQSQSRPLQVDDDVVLGADVGAEVGTKIDEETAGKVEVKLDSQPVYGQVQNEHDLDPIPPFRFNAGDLYPSSSTPKSSTPSNPNRYSNLDDDLYIDPCGYTDEDQPSDSSPASIGAQLEGETGEQITLHDIRDEWRGVFSFDGLEKVWEGVEMFRSG